MACVLLVAACELLVAACMWDLVPGPGIKPGCPALGAWSLTHWTTREVPRILVFYHIPFVTENFLMFMYIFFTSLLPTKELTQQNLSLPSDLGRCSNCVLKNTSSVKCRQELHERKYAVLPRYALETLG